MGMNLLNLQPHKVSRDLSGYITFVYGAPKTGKTTLATQMPKSLLLALEKGYNALPGVVAQDITSWKEMREVYRELKKPEVRANFDAVIVDTVDVAADFCTKYVCNQKDIESLGELGFGKGWTAFKEEFNEIFRGLTQLGYAVFFIGHAKEQVVQEGEKETIYIRPALPNSVRGTVTGLADIYGYAHQSKTNEKSVLTLRSPDDTISCGCRFKYMPNEIPLSYDNLIKAMQEAIDKEAKEYNGEFVTEERNQAIIDTKKEVNFDDLIKKFQDLTGELMSKNQSNADKIITITNKYLGKGKKVSECSPTQIEQIELIIQEVEDLLK